MRKHATLAVLFGSLIGLPAGVGIFTLGYARGASYLTDNPTACANCHVMRDHYSAWLTSSHRSVAVCNDCHTPKGFVAKYLAKAEHGFNHSVAFTTNRFHEPIEIKAKDLEVTEKRCRGCHADITESIEGHAPEGDPLMGGKVSCVRCHGAVGHPMRD